MIIPLKPLKGLKGKVVGLRVLEVKDVDVEKLYSYIRLLREEDAEEIFEV